MAEIRGDRQGITPGEGNKKPLDSVCRLRIPLEVSVIFALARSVIAGKKAAFEWRKVA
jgi:hypothetical protein